MKVRKGLLIGFISLFWVMNTFAADNLAWAVRLKDIATFGGVRTNQLVGYGLIVGIIVKLFNLQKKTNLDLKEYPITIGEIDRTFDDILNIADEYIDVLHKESTENANSSLWFIDTVQQNMPRLEKNELSFNLLSNVAQNLGLHDPALRFYRIPTN
jgi:hypothetical protein